MTQYNTLKVKLSNSQLNKLKSAIKNRTEVTLNLSSNFIGNSNDETNFPHKLLLTDTQVSKICKALANGSSANIKFSKSQLCEMIQSGGVLIPVGLFYPLKMIPKAVEKLEGFSKNTNKIIDLAKIVDNFVGVLKIFLNRNN